ncbi:MAG: mandelate racemase/muconate lactonizing enzyme family protein [Balneolaceae bacterium]
MGNTKGIGRRNFLKKAGLGGLTLGPLLMGSYENQLEHLTNKVNRNSSPSDLEITDMRIAEISGIPFRCPIIRIDTNQGISGYGEVRDGGAKEYALFLKSRILGENPCNVERLFKIIRQFGHHGRQGGGVSGVETALWDLTGKAYGVPVYQLLGGKYRDRIRLYADTAGANDPHVFARRMKETRVDTGYTALKMDIGIELISRIGGSDVLVNTREHQPKGDRRLQSQYSSTHDEYGQIGHPFTRVQITEKGLDVIEEFVSVMRDTVGYEIPLGIDHTGHFDKNEAIKIARRLEPYTLAYLEDLIGWQYIDHWKEITGSTTTPTQTGEDIFGLEGGFKEIIDKRAVDLVHPDLGSSGGILETKRIGDYAESQGIAMNLHYAGSPIGFMASVHAAAATQNFNTLEHHSVENENWYNLFQGDRSEIFDEGYTPVPDKPGLGADPNEDAIRELLIEGAGFFEPTPEWNEVRSWDRLWS